MHLNKTIKRLRIEKGLTQADLARALDISPSAINKWEKGTSSPDLLNLLALSRIFETSVDALLISSSTCLKSQIEEYTKDIVDLIDDDKFLEALQTVKNHCQEYPNDFNLQANLLLILIYSQFGIKNEDTRWIIQQLQMIIRSNHPMQATAIEALVRYYLSIEDFENAQKFLEMVSKESLTHKGLLAQVYEKQKDYKNAYKANEEILYEVQLSTDSALSSLMHLAHIEHKTDLFHYYSDKKLGFTQMFETGEYAEKISQLDSTDGFISYDTMVELIQLVPTLGSFISSKLYSHMDFSISNLTSLHIQIYQDFLNEISQPDTPYSEKERTALVLLLQDKINTCNSKISLG